MEKKNLEKNFERTLSLIKIIEKKKEELYNHLDVNKNLTRNDMIRQISRDILHKSTVFSVLNIKRPGIKTELEEDFQLPLIDDIINDLVEKIKGNWSNKPKKVLYLKKFLELFREINDNDKAILLQSLENEEDLKKLGSKMKSLANSFHLSI